MTWLTNPYRFGGAAVPVGVRSYWRIWVMGVLDNFMAVAALEFAATPGGANQATGGTALTSGFNNASDAFDGNNGTWANRTLLSGNDMVWLGYQFSSPVAVAEVRLRASTTPNQAPKAFFVEASDDGVTWSGVSLCLTTADYTSGEIKSFPVVSVFTPVLRANALAWRLNGTTNNGGSNTSIAELEFRASSGGTSICVGGVAFADRGSGVGNANNAFDGNNGTQYTASSSAACKLWYNFPAAANPQFAALRARSLFAATDTPKDFTIEWTVDGHNWFVAATVTNQTGWTNSEIREFAL